MMEEKLLWYWFVNIKGVGSLTRKKLYDYFKNPYAMWTASEKVLEKMLTKKQLEAWKLSKDIKAVRQSYEALLEEGASFLDFTDQRYPEQLRKIPNPPMGLYLKGRLEKRPLVAIVGTRTPSAYGRKMTCDFACALAEAGIGIVSGMAYGIDAIAHRTALAQKQYTIGVLGGGIDTTYPRDNFNLYMDMYEQGGILSEYNIGVKNLSGLFPERNRIISGMADGVLIIEAAARSGSLITADHALEQGKDIYVIPGRITDPLSEGCNELIRQGAQPVLRPEEIIEDVYQKVNIEELNIPKR